jgi:hypothetical protein
LVAATRIVDVVAMLPDGLQKALLYGAQLYGVFRLLRRFNVGESLATAAGAATIRPTIRRPFGTFTQRAEEFGQSLSNPGDRQRLKELLGEEAARLRILKIQRESQSREAADLATQRARAAERRGELQAAGPGRHIDLFGQSEGQRQFNEEVERSVVEEQKLLDLEQRSTQEVRRTNDEIVHRTRREAEVQQISRRQPQRALDVFESDPLHPVTHTVRTEERPSRGELATPIRAQPSQVILPPGVRQTTEREAQQIVKEVGEATTREAIVGATAGTASAASHLTSEARAGSGAVAGARGALRTAYTAVRGFGSALLGFLGPVELAFLGFMFIPEILGHFQRRAAESAARSEKLSTPALDPGTARRQLALANKTLEDFDKRQEEIKRVAEVNRQALAKGQIPAVPVAPVIPPSDDERKALAVRKRAEDTAAAQKIAAQRGQPVPSRFIEDIQPDIERDIAALKRGEKGAKNGIEIYAKYHAEIAQSREAEAGSRAKLDAAAEKLADAKFKGDPKAINKAQAAFDQAQQGYTQVAAATNALNVAIAVISPEAAANLFRLQSLSELATFLDQQAGLMEQFGATRKGLDQSISAYITGFAKFSASGASRAAKLQQIQQLESGFDKGLQAAADDFTKNLARATTPRQRRRVLTRGLADAQSQLGQGNRNIERADDLVQTRADELEAARRERDRLGRPRRRRRGVFDRPFGLGPAADLFGGDQGQTVIEIQQDRAQSAFETAKKNFDKATALAKGARQGRKKAFEKVADARQKMVEAFLDDSDVSALRVRIAEARGTPMEAAATRLQEARSRERVIGRLVTQGIIKGHQAQVLLLTAEADSAEAAKAAADAGAQQLEEALSRMERVSRIRILKLPEAQRGGAELQNLKEQLDAAKKGGADEKTIQDLTIQYLEQVNTNADDAKQRDQEAEQKRKDAIQKQRENIESIFNLRRSRTDNPIKQARLTVAEIDRELAIPGLTRNERRDLQARRNEAVRDREKAVSDEKLRSLDLEHDIGRISDSAYLAGLRQLFQHAKRGTQLRKDLREKYLRFKHEMEGQNNDFPELNVGNIRLPTAYDVKRLIRQGTQTAPQSTINQSNVIHVDARGSDPEAVTAHISNHLTTSARSGMRAAGLVG